jgi:structural maintenance of chromosome 1
LESSVKSAKKQQADFDEQRNEINALETELAEVRKKAKDFEAQVQEREAQEKLVLSEEQQEEYNNRKQEAGRETAPIKQELEGLVRQQRLDSEMRDTSEAKLRDLQARKKHLAETEEQYERRYSKVQEFIDQTEAKKRELEEELAPVSAANKAASEQQEKLMAQLEDIHEQLNEAKVDIRSDQREIRFREALESMKRIFPGVIGRMVLPLIHQHRSSKRSIFNWEYHHD